MKIPGLVNLGATLRDVIRAYNELAFAFRQVIEGRNNCSGSFSLTASATSTTVNTQGARNCSPTAEVILTPKTANAAAAYATTYPTAGTNQFTVTHANAATTDRTFSYVISGGT